MIIQDVHIIDFTGIRHHEFVQVIIENLLHVSNLDLYFVILFDILNMVTNLENGNVILYGRITVPINLYENTGNVL